MVLTLGRRFQLVGITFNESCVAWLGHVARMGLAVWLGHIASTYVNPTGMRHGDTLTRECNLSDLIRGKTWVQF